MLVIILLCLINNHNKQIKDNFITVFVLIKYNVNENHIF